jgi:hypothetical protein
MKSLKNLTFVLSFGGAWICQAQFHTNTITTPFDAYDYTVDGIPGSPTIDLHAGVTNILDIQTSDDHPVVITTTPDPDDWYTAAAPQDVNTEPMTLTTPASGFPTTLYYVCPVHGFYGEIHISPPLPPGPSPNTILYVRVGTNVVMTSTGTNTTWLLIPEFNSNLTHGAWAPVLGYTNTFANGTNTTVFNRLDPICGPSVFLRIRQQQN